MMALASVLPKQNFNKIIILLYQPQQKGKVKLIFEQYLNTCIETLQLNKPIYFILYYVSFVDPLSSSSFHHLRLCHRIGFRASLHSQPRKQGPTNLKHQTRIVHHFKVGCVAILVDNGCDLVVGKKLENNTKLQTISLVSNIFKLFSKLISRVSQTRVHCSNSSLRNLNFVCPQGTRVLETRVPWNLSFYDSSCYSKLESLKLEMLVC